jgi:phage gpG-like protein
MPEVLRIDGLREFRAALKAADASLPRELRPAFNKAAEVVAFAARGRVPTRSGSLASSIRPLSTQTEGRVAMGSAKVPYAGFIEFGGRVGRKKSVSRPIVKSGRYLYPTFRERRPLVEAIMVKALDDVVTRYERA